MNRRRARTSLAGTLLLIAGALFVWAGQLTLASHCAGDLKGGTGDIEAALALESQSLLVFLSASLASIFGLSVLIQRGSWLVQLAVWVGFLPLAYIAFLVFDFSTLGTACAH